MRAMRALVSFGGWAGCGDRISTRLVAVVFVAQAFLPLCFWVPGCLETTQAGMFFWRGGPRNDSEGACATTRRGRDTLPKFETAHLGSNRHALPGLGSEV